MSSRASSGKMQKSVLTSPPKKKQACTCAATNLRSSRNVEQPKGLCAFNRGAATGPRKDLMVHCEKCGAWICRLCIRSLRVAARAEAKRCKHMQVLLYPVLRWLLADRASTLTELFEPAKSDGVLHLNAHGVLQFSRATGCIFCGDAVLLARARPFARISPALSYPYAQPRGGKRDIMFITVSVPHCPVPSHPQHTLPSPPHPPHPTQPHPSHPIPSHPIHRPHSTHPTLARACERVARGLMKARRTPVESAAYAG